MRALGIFLIALCLPAATHPPLRLSRTIPLPNVRQRIDHMSVDIRNNRLFVAALGNNTVEVIDVKAGKVIHTISGLKSPQGVLYLPDSNRLVVANRDDGTIRIYDAASYQILRTINKLSDADNLRWDARFKCFLAGYGEGFIGAFDADGKQLWEVRLDGHPESFQIETKGNRIFVNLPTSSSVIVIDRSRRAVTRNWPLPVGGNYAMALNEADSRLFLSPRKPPKLLVIDLGGVAVENRVSVGDVDDVFYDAGRHRIYAIGGEGSIDVVHQVDPTYYDPVAVVPTAPGARTGLYVPEWNKLFVAVPHREQQDSEIRVFEVID